METNDQNQAMEERHLAKFKESREILLRDMQFWKLPENGTYAARMLEQLENSLEINASLIQIAEQRLQAMKNP